MTPVIEIIIVGNEILCGRTIDRNSIHMIRELERAGFSVRHLCVVDDDTADLIHAFKAAAERSDVVLVTGGLGPTSDDRTISAVAEAFGKSLVLDDRSLVKIEELFRRHNRPMSESNRRQALIPEGSRAIDNPVGTAPGIRLDIAGTRFYFLPGVPSEMRTLFGESVLPELSSDFEAEKIQTATIHVTGISESELYDRIKHLPGAGDAFAYYPSPEGLVVSIKTGAVSPMAAAELLTEAVRILGDRVYSTTGDSLEQVVGRLLTERRLTLGIAESCTGGLVSHRLTNVPGASGYLLCGIIAYSNESKQRVLGVASDLFERYGAVSAEVAAAMAEGARTVSGSDIAISTTGIAGPGGATPVKPVGLMYAGLATADGTKTWRLQFAEDRLINKSRMSQSVLDILRIHLERGT